MSVGRTRVSVVPPVLLVLALVGLPLRSQRVQTQGGRFQLEEATIADVHRAIQAGRLTCRGLVEAYIDRAKRRHADAAASARTAVLAGIQSGAWRGGSDPRRGVGVRGGVEAPRAAAGVPAASRRRWGGSSDPRSAGAFSPANAAPRGPRYMRLKTAVSRR